MAKPYSEDLRARVVGAVEDGATIPEAADQCGVSISSVVRFLRLHRGTGILSLDEALTPDVAIATDETAQDLFSSIKRAAGGSETIPLQRIRIARSRT